MTICKPIPKLTPEQEAFFWSRVTRGHVADCWPWNGAMKASGYGIFRKVRVHRVAFTLLRGPIPVDKTIDHLCRNRRCVNPSHMEIVTMKENTLRGNGITAQQARQTHCKHGHEFTPENISYVKKGRTCKQCRKDAGRRSKRSKRAKPEGSQSESAHNSSSSLCIPTETQETRQKKDAGK